MKQQFTDTWYYKNSLTNCLKESSQLENWKKVKKRYLRYFDGQNTRRRGRNQQQVGRKVLLGWERRSRNSLGQRIPHKSNRQQPIGVDTIFSTDHIQTQQRKQALSSDRYTSNHQTRQGEDSSEYPNRVRHHATQRSPCTIN